MDAIYSMKVKLEEYYQLLFFSTLKEIRRNRTRLLEIGFHRGKGAFACLKGIYISREKEEQGFLRSSDQIDDGHRAPSLALTCGRGTL